MRPWCDRERLFVGALAVTLFATPAATLAQAPAAAAAAADQGALALARLSLVERKVELEKKGARWQAAVEGGPLQIGEALRTGPDAVARLELPWMALTLSPGSSLRFPDAFLLQATLDSGRALVEARSEMISEVTKAFFHLTAAKATIQVREDAVAQALKLQALQQIKFEHGTGDLAPLLHAQEALARARLDLLRARHEARLAELGLLRAIGLPLP